MRYSLGIQDFRTLREGKFTYVDKTEQLCVIAGRSSYFFLARPRRFGKSLAVATLNELYSGDRELFRGLWAYEHWDFAAKKCPVIWIQFASTSFEALGAGPAAVQAVVENANKLSIVLPEGLDVKAAFKHLIEAAAATSPPGKVVVLIDEYDKPITHALERGGHNAPAGANPEAEAQRDQLRPFYGALKDANPYIELVFITGVCAFSKVSLFSELNNVTNLSIHPLAETLVGITEREMEQTFGVRLSEIDVPRAEVRRRYNGYAFGPGAERLYNPWSLLTFLDMGRASSAWYESGTPAWLVRVMARRGQVDVAGVRRATDELLSFDLTLGDIPSVLYQTGYLTLADYDAESGVYTLDFPNFEVRKAFDGSLVGAYVSGGMKSPQVRVLDLRAALRAGDVAAAVALLDAALADVPYHLWETHGERTYHLITHVLFWAVGLYVRSEVATARGRADVIVETDERVYCFEFKVGAPAAAALAQIEARRYLWPYKASGKELVAVGVSFDKERRGVGEWVAAPG